MQDRSRRGRRFPFQAGKQVAPVSQPDVTDEPRQPDCKTAPAPVAAEAALPSPTRRNAVWLGIQLIAQLFLVVYLRYRARNVNRIPHEGGGLILANHQSFLDPILIGLPLRRPIRYVTRDTADRDTVISWILRKTYVMPINRDRASATSIKEAVRRMQHGFLVGVFPEGTRSNDGSVGDFKPGFIALLKRGGVPVFPVGISGADQALPRGRLWLKPRAVRVVFGEPIPFEQLQELFGKGNEAELIELVHSRVVTCQAEAEEWRKRSTGRWFRLKGSAEPNKP